MKFVGLLSGGKDSCYNILQCIEYGHELICLGNLYPQQEDVQELNSFMYQCAGHPIIPKLAQCFEVPLIRHPITKKSNNVTLQYISPTEKMANCPTALQGNHKGYKSPKESIESIKMKFEQLESEKLDDRQDDEVEDLYDLLAAIKHQYPDIQGVSCGAIVSNYQRYRVEHICHRLGLIPLTYLWYVPRSILLNEIIDCGIEAILVKVAGAGLDPFKHLGKSLSSLYNTLNFLHDKYGLDVCGEGGEYESLVLDMKLFKHYRLNIISSEVLLDEEDVSVGNLVISNCEVVEKTTEELCCHDKHRVNANNLLESLEGIYNMFIESTNYHRPHLNSTRDRRLSTSQEGSRHPTLQANDLYSIPRLFIKRDGLIQSSIISAYNAHTATRTDEHLSVGQQLEIIFDQLYRLCREAGCSHHDIVFVHVYLSDMSLFTEMNASYVKYFRRNPPSRSCVALPMPSPHKVLVEVTIYAHSYQQMLQGKTHVRDVIHVQSISKWAPMNIGPYSQANVILESLCMIAGQIPLDPGRMTLIEPSFDDDTEKELLFHAILCIQHIFRVLQACNNQHLNELKHCPFDNGLTCLVYLADDHQLLSSAHSHTSTSRAILDCITYLIQNYNSLFNPLSKRSKVLVEEDDYDEDEEDDLIDENKNSNPFPINIVPVTSLPRGAPIEIEFIGLFPDALNTLQAKYYHNTTIPPMVSHNDSPSSARSNSPSPHNIDSWPLWPKNQLNESLADHSEEKFDMPLEDIRTDGISLKNQCRYADACYVSGFATVSATYGPRTDVSSCIAVACREIIHTLHHISLTPSQLLNVRIFLPKSIFIDNSFTLDDYKRLAQHVLGKEIAVLVLLVERLQEDDMVTNVSYFGVDLLQLHSEKWIAGA